MKCLILNFVYSEMLFFGPSEYYVLTKVNNIFSSTQNVFSLKCLVLTYSPSKILFSISTISPKSIIQIIFLILTQLSLEFIHTDTYNFQFIDLYPQ